MAFTPSSPMMQPPKWREVKDALPTKDDSPLPVRMVEWSTPRLRSLGRALNAASPASVNPGPLK